MTLYLLKPSQNSLFKADTCIGPVAEPGIVGLIHRKPFRQQRCLVPATGFYEWHKSQKPSQPYFFKLKHAELFTFAGLYDQWLDPKTNKEIQSYTIITTAANGVVGKSHQRMPVILQKEDEEEWVNPDIVEPERLLPLLKQYPNKEMEAYPVSTAVNRPTIDTGELIKLLIN
jgi:putative SOS response-associated peptidase YedK